MKTIYKKVKQVIPFFLFFFLFSNLSQAQLTHNIGIGIGFYEGEPSIESKLEGVEICNPGNLCGASPSREVEVYKSYVNRGLEVQILNLGYEPRLNIIDSIEGNISLSLGMPMNFSYSFYERKGNALFSTFKSESMTSFQGALIGYINWQNAANYEKVLKQRKGLSLGIGVMFSHTGVFNTRLDKVNPPPNNLIKAVVNFGFRFGGSELNILLRPRISKSGFNTRIDDCCNALRNGITADEFGLLVSIKIFFGNKKYYEEDSDD